MANTVASIEPSAHEAGAWRDVIRLAQRPDARIAGGDESVPVPPALLSVLEATGSALARGSRAVVVAMDEELTPAQAAELLGVTRQYVDRLVSRGLLPFRRLPGSSYRRIPTAAVLDHLGRHAAPQAGDHRPSGGGPPRPSGGDVGPDGSGRSPTARGRDRRARLIAATAELVARKGFHGASILEIGAAAGVSGAAIYRHFDNKTQLLVAVFDHVVDELLDGSGRVLASELSPSQALDMLLHRHIRLVLRNPSVFGVYLQESTNLPAADRTRLRSKQRDYVLRWSGLVKVVHPEMADDEVRTRVQATFGLLNSLANFPSPLSTDALTGLLMSMARASLTTAPGGPVDVAAGTQLPPM